MPPFRDIQLLTIGAAAVIDTALLFVLVERRNWRRVVLPVVMLMVGAWLYHMGAFVHTLTLDTPGKLASFMHWLTMTAMAAGLLVMPSAMLHAVLRLRDAGLAANTPPRRSSAACYLPLLALGPIAFMLAADPRGSMIDLVRPLVWPYIAWLTAVNLLSAAAFHRLRHTVDFPRGKLFFSLLVIGLILLTLSQWFVHAVAIPLWPAGADYWQLALVLSPVALVLLFAYFILRFNFMQLVLERSMVYGVIVVGIVLAHRFLLRDFLTQFDERFSFDFAFIEAAALVLLVLAYRPLRQRTAEALRYLMGERVTVAREETRRMAIEMAGMTGRPPQEMLIWFDDRLRRVMKVERTAIWLFDAAGRAPICGGASATLRDDAARALLEAMREQRLIACRRHDAPTGLIDETLGRADAVLAVVIDHPQVSGLVLLGPRIGNRALSDEQVGMIVMLVEQLGVAVHGSSLHAQRLAAERRALQNEKLSTLGLIAGSIAHEVKNPLSSIKTIATVLAEDLQHTPQAQDLGVIISEIDRLSATVTRLLQFARPGNDAAGSGSLLGAIQGTLHLMRHLAKERAVTIKDGLPATLPSLRADDHALREIVFNLLSNAVEAAGAGGEVTVACRVDGAFVEMVVTDTGPGLPPQVQERLFEPFVTTKVNGTGLGLYIVGRHVRELGGEIHCDSDAGRGTRFVVRLPIGSDAAV